MQTVGDIRGFTLPPTLLDGALHSLAVGLLRDGDDDLYLPVGIGRVAAYQAVESEVWCHARWRKNEGKLRTADITLFTDAGQVVAEIHDLQVQRVSRAALRQLSGTGSERLVYDLNWQNLRLPAATNKKTNWLLVDVDQRHPCLATNVAERLAEQGHEVLRLSLPHGPEREPDSAADAMMCPATPSAWGQLFDQLSSADAPFAPDGIAWLFDTPDAQTANGQLPDATRRHCTGLLNLVATLQQRGLRRLQCGIQLITHDAVAIDRDSNVDPSQSQYWGLGRVLGAEHPEMRCRVIDVQAAESATRETAISVTDLLLTETHDNQLAIRSGQFVVPRLKPSAIPRKTGTELVCSPEASYLVTGGLGMLGRQAAKWLAEKGARQVVLVSRQRARQGDARVSRRPLNRWAVR